MTLEPSVVSGTRVMSGMSAVRSAEGGRKRSCENVCTPDHTQPDIVSSVQVTRRETEDRALWEGYEWIVTDGDGGYRE